MRSAVYSVARGASRHILRMLIVSALNTCIFYIIFRTSIFPGGGIPLVILTALISQVFVLVGYAMFFLIFATMKRLGWLARFHPLGVYIACFVGYLIASYFLYNELSAELFHIDKAFALIDIILIGRLNRDSVHSAVSAL
ncbi:MAG: hypothetical protein PHX82_16995 [Paracoccaceae bacterium]|nr:hypothetical protein [Paracoccaceae bacterium]